MKRAKNLIIFVADGMSIPTQTAARMYMGGEEKVLSFEKFPSVGLSKVRNVNHLNYSQNCKFILFADILRGLSGARLRLHGNSLSQRHQDQLWRAFDECKRSAAKLQRRSRRKQPRRLDFQVCTNGEESDGFCDNCEGHSRDGGRSVKVLHNYS